MRSPLQTRRLLGCLCALAIGAMGSACVSMPPAAAQFLGDACKPSVPPSGPGETSRTISACTAALERTTWSAQERAELLVRRARAYAARRDIGLALADIAAAARLVPQDPLVVRRHAEALQAAGNLAAADQEYGRALLLEPNPAAWLARCAIRLVMGRHVDAIGDCETAHATDPSEQSALLMARSYAAAGRHDSSRITLQDAARMFPASVPIRRALAAAANAARRDGGEAQSPAANASRR